MARRQTSLVLCLVFLLGTTVTHLSQRSVDELRYQQGAWDAERMRPNGQALRTAAMGYHTFLADALWLRTVLVAAEVYEDRESSKVTWLRESLLAIAQLDPSWRTLYFYGGGFLRVTEDIDGSNQLFELGHAALPDDSYFPFSRGMNSYLYPDEASPESSLIDAADWIERAAALPQAPGWYKGTAAVFRSEAGSGQRDVAIEYLTAQLENETRPKAREVIELRLARLQHDQIADLLDQARQGYEAQFGQELGDVALLVDEGKQLPPEPLGSQWIIGGDGMVRSEIVEAELEERGRLMEREYLTHESRRDRRRK